MRLSTSNLELDVWISVAGMPAHYGLTSTVLCEEEEGGAEDDRSDEECLEESCFLWATSWEHCLDRQP